MRLFNHLPRAQFCGSIRWLCPNCGKVNENKLHWRNWKVSCTEKNCQETFIVGFRFGYMVKMLRQPIPPHDYSFPEGTMQTWQGGKEAHEVYPLDTDDTIVP